MWRAMAACRDSLLYGSLLWLAIMAYPRATRMGRDVKDPPRALALVAACCLLQFGRRQPQQAPGDNQLLNLLCAFEDIQNLGITGPLFQ